MKTLKFALLVGFWFASANGAGSAPPSIKVSVQQLIAAPEKYNGKQVSVVGYYRTEHHGAFLCPNAVAARDTDPRKKIVLDFANSSVSRQLFMHAVDGYVDVTGIFEYREFQMRTGKDGERIMTMGFGWMNSYEKQITNISHFAKVSAPRSSKLN